MKAGQKVKKGDLLGTFNRKTIKEAGLEDMVMMMITNSSDYNDILVLKEYAEVVKQEKILSLI